MFLSIKCVYVNFIVYDKFSPILSIALWNFHITYSFWIDIEQCSVDEGQKTLIDFDDKQSILTILYNPSKFQTRLMIPHKYNFPFLFLQRGVKKICQEMHLDALDLDEFWHRFVKDITYGNNLHHLIIIWLILSLVYDDWYILCMYHTQLFNSWWRIYCFGANDLAIERISI